MQAVYRTGPLPSAALEAAAAFHSRHATAIAELLADAPESLVIVFPGAAYDHRGWRRAVIADLARAHAPLRINGVVEGDPARLAQTAAFLEMAKGVTGQLLAVDGLAA